MRLWITWIILFSLINSLTNGKSDVWKFNNSQSQFSHDKTTSWLIIYLFLSQTWKGKSNIYKHQVCARQCYFYIYIYNLRFKTNVLCGYLISVFFHKRKWRDSVIKKNVQYDTTDSMVHFLHNIFHCISWHRLA